MLKKTYPKTRRFRRIHHIGFVVLAAAVLFLLPRILTQTSIISGIRGNAEYYFTKPQGELSDGQTFTTELRVKTSTNINAVGVVVLYNPQLLEVLNMSTADSFCSFFIDNSFDNIKGEITLSCGTPNPGYKGDSQVIKLSFRSKGPGTTDLSLKKEQSQILANDGKGTNLLTEYPKLPLVINQSL